MALNFNCGQYQQAFNSNKLQNWERPSCPRKRPTTKEGFTQVVANDRGHLLPSVPRPTRSPWGTFVGTWDLPKKLPGNKQLDPTARSADAHFRQMSAKMEADEVISGKSKHRRPKAGQPIGAMSPKARLTPLAPAGPVRPSSQQYPGAVVTDVPDAITPRLGGPLEPSRVSPARGSPANLVVTTPPIDICVPPSRPDSAGRRSSLADGATEELAPVGAAPVL